MCTTRDSLADTLILDIYTDRDRLDPCLFSNRTESVLAMKLWLVLLAMALLTACLPSGKMERGGDFGNGWGSVSEGWNKVYMTLGYHAHHLLYILYIGLGAAIARIRVYTVTGDVHYAHSINTKVVITQGRRILLTCGVTGLSEENGVVSYRWFHSLTG